MEANDSIRTDASTIHRMVTSDSKSGGSSASSGSLSEIEDAQTVIRGSSRVLASPNSWETLDRTPAAVAKVLLGQRLNHFLLEELIGGGGMGAVFRARDEQLDRIVAIKVIPFVGEDPDLQRRFRNEAQSAAKLDHPNIARVFDVGSQENWHYIVFEYISGINIRDQVTRDGPHSIDDAVYYTCQLADAIQHASERGIVHRDIKPSNVLIGDGDVVKLVDMGLARSENLELSEDMTASGVTLGTFDYISPEQARDPRDADVRSDIYSLGCTLYFMLTGRPPFPGGTMLQKLLSHGNAPPPDPRLLREELSDDLTAIIHKMLAKSPADRYQKPGDLIADLKELANRENLARVEALGVAPAAPPSLVLVWIERHLPWMIAAALLVASTLWLQLVSLASRENFTVAIPENAVRLSTASLAEATNRPQPEQALVPAVTDGNGAGSNADSEFNRSLPSAPIAPGDGVILDGGVSRSPATLPVLSGIDVAKPPETSKPPFFSDASEPPKLANVPLPRELTSEAMNSTASTSPAATATAGENSIASPFGSGQSNNGASNTIQSGVTPVVIRVVAQGDVGTAGQPDVAVTTSLAEAIDWAQRYSVNRIEFATPLVVSPPVEIKRDGLVLTSLVGGTIIRFETSDAVSMQRSRMISIGTNRIEFQQIHFQWTVQSSQIDGGSLITMNDNKLVRLSDCTITIENPSRRDEVFAFDVVTDPEMLDRQHRTDIAGSLPLVAIELENVIVRGEISMIHMDFAAELQLQWDNGLLAVSRRMIDTAGALTAPAPTAGPIQLSINRLTAYVPRGLVRMRLGVSGGYPVMIDREARNSVFVIDPGVPHFEITGLAKLDDEDVRVRLRGEANAYDAEPTLNDPVLVKMDQAGSKSVFRISNVVASTLSWEDERSPRWAVRWSELELPGVPPSQFTPADFRQDGTVLSGFDERMLPRLPPSSETLPTSTPPLTGVVPTPIGANSK